MLANLGIPMIFIHWPLMLCALLPVIILEALLVRRCLSMPVRDAFIGMTKANLLSTLMGVPLAWLGMLALQSVVTIPSTWIGETWGLEFDSPVLGVVGFLISIAWLFPAKGCQHWMMPAAVALLLVPCFFLSVLLEYRSCARTWTKIDLGQVKQGVLKANVGSYCLLFLLACGWVTWELAVKGPRIDRNLTKQVALPNNSPGTAGDNLKVAGEHRHR